MVQSVVGLSNSFPTSANIQTEGFESHLILVQSPQAVRLSPAELVTMFHGQNVVDHVWNMVVNGLTTFSDHVYLTLFWPCSDHVHSWPCFMFRTWSTLVCQSDFWLLCWPCSDRVLTMFIVDHVSCLKLWSHKQERNMYKSTLLIRNWILLRNFFIYCQQLNYLA